MKEDGTPLEKEEDKIRQERDLPVEEVRHRVTKSSDHGENLYKQLLAKDIFKLGLRMQCPKCVRHSWFSLDDVDNVFDCPKCLSRFPAIGHLDRAKWRYKTAGPFSVPGYADGAFAVLLALEFFNEFRMHGVRRTPVVNFKAFAPNKQDLEVDFALLWEEARSGERIEGVIFGECKTYGQFGPKDFQRMRYLAKTFPGAVLVFSTLRKALTRKEIGAIRRIAKAGRKYWKAERPINPVLILTGTELLNWLGPPSCWEEPIKKKFEYVMGLLDLCNATQQIYLGLPSWTEEWRRGWEKRRQRRLGAVVQEKRDAGKAQSAGRSPNL